MIGLNQGAEKKGFCAVLIYLLIIYLFIFIVHFFNMHYALYMCFADVAAHPSTGAWLFIILFYSL